MGWSILILFGLAGAVPVLARWLKPWRKIDPVFFLAAASGGIFTWFLLQIPAVSSGTQAVERFSWIPMLRIDLLFVLDGLGLLMALLISGIGTLVLMYGGNYLKGHPSLPHFYILTLAFMGAMLGVVTSGNALMLFVFWELTSITSFLLIGFEHQRDSARSAAWQALLVTGGGGLALLAGLILMGQAASTYEISRWVEMAATLQTQPTAAAAFLLILLGAMTKSAIFPFHFWLPNAMEAPTPVSAYLHSATMVKAGLYLLARLFPVLSGMALWQPLLVAFGLLTLITGALLSLKQTDLKKLLAYTTVAALGTILFLLGIGTDLAVKAAVVFLLGHALYKGALFLATGSVDHGAGTRDIRRLGNLARAMPLTAAAGGIAALSMAGMPPLFGFISKELVYESLFPLVQWNGLLLGLVAASFVVIVAVAGWIGFLPFWGKQREDLHPHEGSPRLWLPPLLLALLSLGLGFFPQVGAKWLISPAVSALTGNSQGVKLSLWHGITPVLGLSLLTLALGAVVYAVRGRLQPVFEIILTRAGQFGPGAWYRMGWDLLLRFAAFLTRVLQNGYLRNYIETVILATVSLVGMTLLLRGGASLGAYTPAPRFYDVILVGVIITATVLVIRTSSRLATIALLGSIGFSIALLFLLYSAPDLAMVQFAIETLTVILFVLVIYRLPKFAQLSSRKTRLFDGLVAVMGGVMMTVLMLIASANPAESLLAPYFLDNSLSLANGRNVVNVILVDFRGLDTLGEISVLAIAAIGVSALLRLVTRKTSPSTASRKEVPHGTK